jgi:hypothetical protein
MLQQEFTIVMPGMNQNAHPRLTSIAAQLFVRDLKASTDFFTSKLGFTIDFVYGDPPFYGQVSRDNARLALRHVDEPVSRTMSGDERTCSPRRSRSRALTRLKNFFLLISRPQYHSTGP